jgi:glutathione S-transferase
MMKLYWCDVLMPRKVCALARHLELPVAFERIELGEGAHKAPGHLARNPNGKVPVLEEPDGRTLWESNAILVRLAQIAGSDMWPTDPQAQAEVIRWFCWDMDRFTSQAGALYFEYVIRPRFDLGSADPESVETARAGFREAAAVLDAHLSGRDWLLGDKMSIADFAVAVTLPYAKTAHIPVDEFPAISRWHERLETLEAWREPFPPAAQAA